MDVRIWFYFLFCGEFLFLFGLSICINGRWFVFFLEFLNEFGFEDRCIIEIFGEISFLGLYLYGDYVARVIFCYN